VGAAKALGFPVALAFRSQNAFCAIYGGENPISFSLPKTNPISAARTNQTLRGAVFLSLIVAFPLLPVKHR
jgi:hypothetical protein